MGYQGKQCDEDINECETLADPCQTAGTDQANVTSCVNTFGGYFCRCKTGLQRKYTNDGGVECKSEFDTLSFNQCRIHILSLPFHSTFSLSLSIQPLSFSSPPLHCQVSMNAIMVSICVQRVACVRTLCSDTHASVIKVIVTEVVQWLTTQY